MRRYRRRQIEQPPDPDGMSAALVYHPTGTGKTAVIAGLAHGAAEIGTVLVLTNREAIRDQLVRELCGALFVEPAKFGLSPRIALPKICFALTSSTQLHEPAADVFARTNTMLPSEYLRAFHARQFRRLVDSPQETLLAQLSRGNAVLVMTVQLLLRLRTIPAVYETVRKSVDLVIFDEGHYEPAARYSEAVRELACPLVLMTATPFRNDLKAFRIRPDDVHIYRFAQAVAEQRIRDVEVITRTPTRSADQFCEDILQYCTSVWGPDPEAWTQRVIIRCDDSGCITRLGEAFIARGFGDRVIGVHDRFPAARPGISTWRHRSVPAPAHTDALIWIHQFKLIEGIDDHRFQVVAFFDPMTSVRAVVQQIGRVIRAEPGRPVTEKGVVLDHFGGRIKTYWELYRNYDNEASAEALTSLMSRFYLKKLITAQPRYDYIDRKFRRLLNILDGAEVARFGDVVADEILFPRTVVFKRIPPGLPVEEIVKLVDEALTGDDYEFVRYDMGAVSAHTVIYLCGRAENVSFLNTYFFAETHLHARLLMLLPDQGLLAVTSTDDATTAHGLANLPVLESEWLERLLSPGPDNVGRISTISSRNTNLGPGSLRGRTVTAPSLESVPAGLDESSHVVSSLAGYNGSAARITDNLEYQEIPDEDLAITLTSSAPTDPEGHTITPTRRYIGFSRGRVTEYAPPLRVRAFRRWVGSLTDQMGTSARYDRVLGRYAEPASPELIPGAPLNLLLDLADLAGHYQHRRTGEEISSDDMCVDRSGAASGTAARPAGRFIVPVNNTKYELTLTYNTAAQRYRIDAPALDADFMRTDGRPYALTRALNETQAFTVIPENRDIIYVHGGFYAPGLKFGPKRFNPSMFPVGYCLYPSPIFQNHSTEKGVKNGHDDQYCPNTLFGLIDSWKDGFNTSALELDRKWAATDYAPEPLEFLPTVCICEDMGAESCDFIIADNLHRRVILVHAKASEDWRPFSASAVQEVCAQAQKNTAIFSTFSPRPPANLDLWNRAHKFNRHTIKHRIRKSAHHRAKDIWTNELEPLLRNPHTSREVWIVLGNMVSAGQLLENLRSDDPAPAALQLNQLLHSTITSIGSVNVKTRIFCAP